MNIDQTLRDLGLTLPPPPKPVASYIPAVRTGHLLFVSGQLPFKDGKLLSTGPVPSACSVEQAQQAAAQCLLNALAIIHAELAGDWSRLARIVRLNIFVLSDPAFTQHPQVANGASDLLQKLLGDPGRHTRVAVGVSSLPLAAPVELDLIAELRP